VLTGGALGAARTMDVVAQVAAGLHAAHSTGLIHRDITPANIMFAPDGTVKITDFGIAHAVGSVPLTTTGTVLGTPGYIAPERVSGIATGPASDLYALGVVAYEGLTGSRPFTGPPLEVAIAHRDRPLPPLPPSVPAEVAALVMMLTAKDPAWRPASAGDVADQAARLRDAIQTGGLHTSPLATPLPTAADKMPPLAVPVPSGPAVPVPGRPHRPRALAVAAAAVAAIGVLVVLSVIGFAPGSSSPGGSHPPAVQPSVSHPAAASSAESRASSPAASSGSPLATQQASTQPSVSPSAHATSSAPAETASASASTAHHGHKNGKGNGNGNGNS